MLKVTSIKINVIDRTGVKEANREDRVDEGEVKGRPVWALILGAAVFDAIVVLLAMGIWYAIKGWFGA